jgi:hypothetical protein
LTASMISPVSGDKNVAWVEDDPAQQGISRHGGGAKNSTHVGDWT